MRFHLTDSSAGSLNRKTGIVEFSAAPACTPKPATTPPPVKHVLSFEAFVMNAVDEIYAGRDKRRQFAPVDNSKLLSADSIYAERRRNTYRAAGETA